MRSESFWKNETNLKLLEMGVRRWETRFPDGLALRVFGRIICAKCEYLIAVVARKLMNIGEISSMQS